MKRLSLLACVAGVVLTSSVLADGLKSGPQPGAKLPGAFHPLNVTGSDAGKKSCLVCRNDDHPVAMIFAREIDEPLTLLIKKIDAATIANSKAEMGSFVIFCSNDEELPDRLKALAQKEAIKECVLAIDNVAGPKGYKVEKEAAVTVVLYTDREVQANYAFKKGEMKPEDVEKILKDLPKILSKK
jgi:hypothetical protein